MKNNVELNDDVTLFELNSQYNVARNWNVGASVYWVKDNSSGKKVAGASWVRVSESAYRLQRCVSFSHWGRSLPFRCGVVGHLVLHAMKK